ncbi:MAG: YwbE family protein [Bacteroidales bacterium]|nr:YwbE family protein [Bacteroidales bacterium]
MGGTKRSNIQTGMKVSIVLKQNQYSGRLTEGVIKNILTKASIHHHGIKVRLENGLVGRVKEIITEEE